MRLMLLSVISALGAVTFAAQVKTAPDAPEEVAAAAVKPKRLPSSQPAPPPKPNPQQPASRPAGDAKPYNPGVPDLDHPNKNPNPEKPLAPPNATKPQASDGKPQAPGGKPQ